MTDKILSSIDGPIGRIVFNQPEKRNAGPLEMWVAVAQAPDRFDADDAVRVIVLSGAGGKGFTAGADLSKFESERASDAAAADPNPSTAPAEAQVHASANTALSQ